MGLTFFISGIPFSVNTASSAFTSSIFWGDHFGYKVLTPEQKALAAKNSQEASSKKVYRFKDKSLNIVADKATDRVLVMFEQFEKIDQQTVQNLVGELFVTDGDPTVSANDMVVYWAWGEKERFTAEQFQWGKEKK